MLQLDIHCDIKKKLDYFHSVQKIPNIIFHGPSGCGKRTILNYFIHRIYNDDKEKIKTFCMYINCAFGKGIKFIREELKFFAKTHIHSNGGDIFKSIILLNADKLTMDAQSALRRCIELFSHTTRFFIIVEDKYKLLKPILSRFCEIYIPEPKYQGEIINLYKYNISKTFPLKEVKQDKMDYLKNKLGTLTKNENMLVLSKKLYEKGYSGLDIIQLLENPTTFTKGLGKDSSIFLTTEKRYELLIAFNKVRKEFRCEKLLMLFILTFLFQQTNYPLENISFM
jgi:replication-associated recombination protein RarA